MIPSLAGKNNCLLFHIAKILLLNEILQKQSEYSYYLRISIIPDYKNPFCCAILENRKIME